MEVAFFIMFVCLVLIYSGYVLGSVKTAREWREICNAYCKILVCKGLRRSWTDIKEVCMVLYPFWVIILFSWFIVFLTDYLRKEI